MSTPLLAAKLIELRQERDLCQQDVADYLGMTREGYCHYERNTREPNLEVLLRLCDFYEIDISELVNTKLIPITPISKKKTSLNSGNNSDSQSPTLLRNMDHMIKLFSGKFLTIDITDVTKRDLDYLVKYKELADKDQAEIRDYVEFKHQRAKKSK